MTKTKFYGFLCIVLLISNGFLLYHFLQGPKRPEGPKKIIIKKLHLDEKQVVKYEQLIRKHRSGIRKTEGQIKKLKQQLYSNPDTKNDSLISLLGQKQMEIEKIHCAHFLEIKQLCRTDQQDDFKKLSWELARLFDHKPPHHRK